MNVLIISEDPLFPIFGGHREYMFYTIKSIISMGNEVTYITWRQTEGVFDVKGLHYINLKIKKSRNISIQTPFTLKVRWIIYALGLGPVSLIWASRLSVYKFKKNIGNENFGRFDLIINDGPSMNKIARYLRKKYKISVIDRIDWVGLPLVISNMQEWNEFIGENHGDFYTIIRVLSFLMDLIIKRIELIIIGSDSLLFYSRNDSVRFYVSNDIKKRFVITPTLSKGNLIMKVGEDSPSRYCLFFSGAHMDSFIGLEALKVMAKTLSGVHFVVTGFSPNSNEVFPDNISFLGVVSNNDFENLISHATIIVFPVIFGSGAQMRVIKALSYGKAIVATSVITKFLPEQELNEACIIEDHPKKFVEWIKSLMEDDSLRKYYQKNATNYYSKNLSGLQHIRKYASMLDITYKVDSIS